MKKLQQYQLKRQLKQAGASHAEVAELLPLALNLNKLSKPLADTLPSVNLPSRKPLFITTAVLLSCLVLVMVSQSVLPTSWLYPVQKASDNVAIMVHSDYRGDVMMKRAQQVNQLVASGAQKQTIMVTLADYKNEAARYKAASHADYADFEYCKTSLAQAEAIASPDVKAAIKSGLSSLENT